jgi:hypothetical protein
MTSKYNVLLVAINVGVSSALPVCKDSPRIIIGLDIKELKSWSDCHGTFIVAKSFGLNQNEARTFNQGDTNGQTLL